MSRRLPLSVLAAALCAAMPATAFAQYIPIRTLPLATGDQFAIFPSANEAMGGVSIAVRDSLLDPFVNPAKGARMKTLRVFSTPTFYDISRSAGGGQTLPVGGLTSAANLFGGAVMAIQQINPSHADENLIFAPQPFNSLQAGDPSIAPFPVAEQGRAKTNRYAFATLGTRLGRGISLGGSLMYADLHRVDGVDQLYAGSQSISQYGGNLDARLGLLKDWSSGASLEALFVHNRLSMTHDVTFAETFYDPNTRGIRSRPRSERNLDRTNTWGMHLAWQRPVGDSGWRIGAFATGNLLSHPKLPNYQIVDVVRPVPWDPGHSAAYNIGVGIAQQAGASTFALDLIYEPILTHTWGEAPNDVPTSAGQTILAGGKTTENRFTFSNAIARLGVAQDFVLDGFNGPLRLQAGIAAHAVRYWLQSQDHVALTSRSQGEHWLEWTPTWGASLRFGDVDLRYVGHTTHGLGRPGIAQFVATPGGIFVADASTGPSILSAPNGPLSLAPANVTTHQLSISVPLP